MKIAFASKRDKNGNRYYLMVDSDKKEFARVPSHWYSKEDFVEVSKTELRNMAQKVEEAGYTEVQHMSAAVEF